MAPKAAKKAVKKATKKAVKKSVKKTTKKKAKKAKKAKKPKRKAKRVSKVAKGKHARSVVFRGNKEKTKTGMTKADLIKNKNGRIVSKKQSANSKKRFSKNLGGWLAAVQKARKALGIKGFCAIGGKTAKGKAFHAKAKSFYKKK
jgi:hypothetical protein